MGRRYLLGSILARCEQQSALCKASLKLLDVVHVSLSLGFIIHVYTFTIMCGTSISGCLVTVNLIYFSLCILLRKVEITKLKLDKDRRKILERKARPKLLEKEKGIGKHKEKDVSQAMES